MLTERRAAVCRLLAGRRAGLILEGLFVSRRELDAFVDRFVLVETPAALRCCRQTERADASSEWLERWDAAERHFFRHMRPPATLDLVVRAY